MTDLQSEIIEFGNAHGPMAVEELTTYKYIIRGAGQNRE